MTAIWYQAERLYRERFHVQQCLTDDMPVLIRAAELPDARTKASRRPHSPSAGTRPAAHIGSGTATPSVPGTADRWANLPEPCASEGRPDPNTNTNGSGRSSLDGISAAGASQETS